MSAGPPFGGIPYAQQPGPAYQPYPAPGGPRAPRWRAWLAGVAAAVVSAVAGGAIGYHVGLDHAQVKTASTPASAASPGASAASPGASAASPGASAASPGCPAGRSVPAPSATPQADTSLLARLVPMPGGTSPAGTLKQGALSLDDYISALYSNDRSEQPRIAARCFQAVVHREWQTPGGTVVSVWLIQFAAPNDARSYTLAGESADSADPVNKVKLAVQGVGDGMYLANPALDKLGNTFARLLGDRGNVSMIVHVYVPARLDEATAVQVLKAQYARLAG